MTKRITTALALAAALGLAMPLAGCQEDLGDPELRVADFEAVDPNYVSPNTNSNNPIADWLPDCGANGVYACPPYGLGRGDVIANKIFAAGNPEADFWSNADRIFSLSDYYQSESRVLFVFYGQNG